VQGKDKWKKFGRDFNSPNLVWNALPTSVWMFVTVDSPEIGHPSDPGKLVAFRTCPISGPHEPVTVAAKTRHFEELVDLRVSDLRTVNFMSKKRSCPAFVVDSL
jgi:hypothetical protein